MCSMVGEGGASQLSRNQSPMRAISPVEPSSSNGMPPCERRLHRRSEKNIEQEERRSKMKSVRKRKSDKKEKGSICVTGRIEKKQEYAK